MAGSGRARLLQVSRAVVRRSCAQAAEHTACRLVCSSRLVRLQLATNVEETQHHIAMVACHACSSSIPVQVPLGHVDFTFPCPRCGAENMVQDAPKRVQVLRPDGHLVGDTIRFLTPEGIKMEASIPPGVPTGSVFTVHYRLKQAAKDAALLHLSEHQVDDRDLEVAPEDCRECSICLEEYSVGDMQAFLPCFHRFHVDCARGSLKESRRCPMCNQDFHAAAADARKLVKDPGIPEVHAQGARQPTCACTVS